MYDMVVTAQRAPAPTPTAPGEQSVNASVTVVFSISTP
jgi:uncharacterized protein YggE